jgi:hypothetical protein
MSTELLHELWDYHHWANRRLFDVTAALGEETAARHVGTQFRGPTIRGMFTNLLPPTCRRSPRDHRNGLEAIGTPDRIPGGRRRSTSRATPNTEQSRHNFTGRYRGTAGVPS